MSIPVFCLRKAMKETSESTSLHLASPQSGPEPYLILAWVGSLLGFIMWLRASMDVIDLAVMVATYVFCLPLISPSTTSSFVARLGGPVCGLICGMQVIDMVFDICIVKGTVLQDGGEEFTARKIAYLYYHCVLNASHVNAVLLFIIVASFLGSLVGVGRSAPHTRHHWMLLGILMTVGTGGYLVNVVPRYLVIREAAAFDPHFFDNWEVVIAARLVLYGSILSAFPSMFKLQTLGVSDGTESADKTKQL
eukprot:CAMPEP_0178410890 /NCGR_PEP_ID=MMETSP0689_2-20121128/21216_1 /TAXON_ID=160604 /ORGANISM="Amphidinium massartii, Strain CS-259" /LENGTH=249 /DNA_ID=CAMNT_0020032087 /DNA_START=12 /DNA_END=761 /DNA_ORIENTATION=+